jgi:glycosyltransferase involved in cell wall biosynthesis
MHLVLFLYRSVSMSSQIVTMSSATLPRTACSLLCLGMGWFPDQAGGLNRYLYELMHTLIQDNMPIDCYGIGLPIADPDSRIALINLAEPTTSLPQRLWQCRQNFRQQFKTKPQAINLHFALSSWPILGSLPQNVPITFNFHGPWAGESQAEGAGWLNVAFKKWVEQRVYDRCDRFITLSQAFADLLHRDYNIPQAKIYVIPGGINTQDFQITHSRQQAREQMGFPRDRPILFTPRRLVQRMGIDKLLEALVIVKQQVPAVWLAIAGKGSQREALAEQAAVLGLTDHVRFLGYVPDADLPICYQAADLTVVPSQSLEGFGLVLLESLACGTPVLSTPVGGMPEVLRPFDPHLVTRDATALAIADRLLEYLTGNLELPDRESCRNYAVQHYDWQIIAPRVQEVLLRPLGSLNNAD